MNIQSVVNIHIKDKWGWFYIPSLILSSSFLVNLLVSLLINNDEKFYSGGVTSILVYALVLGIIVVAQSFPFAIGMSITRKDYFFGTVLMGLATSFTIGALLGVFSYIEYISNGWGNRFHFFYFPYLNDGTNFLEKLPMFMILAAFLFFLGFFISSFARRYGGKGILILSLSTLVAGSIVVLLFHHYHVWSDIFQWLLSQTAAELSYWLLPLILINMAASFLLLKKASI
ncbi:hypothetical protein [Siminovitchia fordii]|uniref:Uncharacterized protein n=1 Tax=Siminovitchia fordii TaxID=254759 RepID=A0ABQ4K3P0_9BACI|nr:hypothetical protein [Siminovitchia fordii]GIN20365.1 hypothetical protein J1TS3_14990 [Siminovitchia fordii]